MSADGALLTRELCGQNVPWWPAGPAEGVRGLAVPREAANGIGVGLYGVTDDGRLLYQGEEGWREVGAAPGSAIGLAIADCTFYGATSSGELWRQPFGGDWEPAGSSEGAVALGGMNGRLFALDSGSRLLTRLPPAAIDEPKPGWQALAEHVPGGTFTAHAGLIITAGHNTPLRWRPV